MAKCPVCLKDAGAGRAFEWHFKTHAAKKAGQTSNRPTPLSQLRAAKQKAANESLQMTEIPETLSMPMDIDIEPIPSYPTHVSPSPEPARTTRTGRRNKFPRGRYTDFLPGRNHGITNYVSDPAPTPLPSRTEPTPPEPTPEPQQSPTAHRTPFQTPPDEFGRFRVYPAMPTSDPDDLVSLDSLCDTGSFAVASSSNTRSPLSSFGVQAEPLTTTAKDVSAPFLNMTVFRLMNWFYGGSSMKSIGELDRLVEDVLLAEDYDKAHLEGFKASRENARMDSYQAKSRRDGTFSSENGWQEHTVKLRMPAEKVKFASEEEAPIFEVPGLFHRDILSIIRSAYTSDTFYELNTMPYKEYVQRSPDQTPEAVIGEGYSAEAHYEFWEEVQSAPRPSGDTMEHIVAVGMVWSDSTHLANFGDASLWPGYWYHEGHSKYIRAKPTSFSSNHFAYMPKLPDNIVEAYVLAYDKPPSAAMLTHLKRELMQQIWAIILDDKFMDAYKHGIEICCADGIWRRVFPRISTYSADYPEKVLLSGIKYLGKCPCPRCLVQKDQIGELGTRADQNRREKLARVDDRHKQGDVDLARGFMFTRGDGPTGKAVEDVLGDQSRVPTRNTFSQRFLQFGFNFYDMFVVDFLHEFELGVWKAILTHLIRILYSIGKGSIATLDKRFREMPTFGRDTIRKFHTNVSEQKKLAARDFEDILQVSIPCFEGLLPEPYNGYVLDLLWDLATWLSYGKLRQHTDSTLESFDEATKSLGFQVRKFTNTTSPQFRTTETPREETARKRRAAAKKAKEDAAAAASGDPPPAAKPARQGPKWKKFNDKTYKYHSLGDYVRMIRRHGTTDSFSTQIGELEHRRVKRFYARTNKNKFARQCARIERRQRILRQMNKSAQKGKQKEDGSTHPKVALAVNQSDPLPFTSPRAHHHISESTRYFETIPKFLGNLQDDPAIQDFLPRLRAHLLSRLRNEPWAGDEVEYSDEELHSISFVNHRIFRHKVMRVNYTTYDVRRAQDSLNPRTHADFMVLAHEDDEDPSTGSNEPEAYWYGRIIGIFHALVNHRDSATSQPQRMDFLWVRWFGADGTHRSGVRAKRLPRIGFVDVDDGGAFGFVDPAEVIRAVHLMPAYAHGRTTGLLGRSIARQPRDGDEDWQYYYVGIFADRDMFMRFRGGGIGHKALRHVEQRLGHQQDEIVSGGDIQVDIEGVTTAGSADFDDANNSDNYDSDEEADYGYQYDDNRSENGDGDPVELGSEDEDDIDDLGAEDGEGPADITEEDGYDCL